MQLFSRGFSFSSDNVHEMLVCINAFIASAGNLHVSMHVMIWSKGPLQMLHLLNALQDSSSS